MKRRGLLVCAAVVLVDCAGVQRNLADNSKRDPGTECASSAECAATTTCVRGRCEYDGKIASPAPPQARGVNAPCARDADCNSDQLCLAKFCEPKDLAHQ